jgi:transcriptional regulator with XRE-family HTH domain
MAKEPQSFGEFLSVLLKDRGVTQKGFAAKARVGQPYVSQIITGVNLPSPRWADMVADALELDEKTRIELHRRAAKDIGFILDLPPIN